MAGPLVSGINVFYLYVRDLERSVAFYRDRLGLPLELDAKDRRWAEASLPGGVRFALHEWHPDAGEIGAGTIRFDFEVADVAAAAERLRSAGVEVGEVRRAPWGSVCDFVDPDGYHVQLFEQPG